MLWPLADRPRLAPGVPGGTIPVRLVDDDLATSLATGGRLDILLSAAEVSTSHDVDPDGAVGRALCLAVDPDLLVTVNAMTAGYVVSDSPEGPAQLPGTPTHPGAGQAVATEWLNRLRALAHRTCVAPLPYAQADLDALQRVNDRGLSAAATTAVNSIVDRILDVPSVRGATLLPDGPLTDRAVNLLGSNESTVAIAAADLSAPDAQGSSEATVDTAPRRLSPEVVVASFDPAVGAALAGAGSSPAVPTYLDSSLTVRLAHDSETARRQDALGSMFWHALRHDDAPRTQILVPPATWNLQADDAHVILTALATTIRSGLAIPRPLPAVVAEAAARTEPSEPVGAYASARGRFGDDVTAAVAGQVGRLWGLTSALSTDERTGTDRHPVHRPAARGHAARAEPIRAARHPQWNGPAAPGRRRQDDQRPVRRGHDRQPGRLLHPGYRAQPPAAGAAQRPGRSHPGAAAGRRPAGDDGHRRRPDRVAAGLSAAAGSDRSELHPAGRHRRDAADPGRPAAGRSGAPVGAFQRLRQGAVRDHHDAPRPCWCCWPDAAFGTGSAASPTAPTWTGPTHPAPGPRTWTTRPTIGSNKSTGYESRPPAGRTATPPATAAAATPDPGLAAHGSPAARPRGHRSPATGTVRRRTGIAVVGDGVRHAGQPAHRLRPDRAPGGHPGRRAVQRVLGGQSAAEPGGRAGTRGDLHRDIRPGAGPRRTGRPRRRRGFRAPAGHADDRAAGVGDRVVGARRAAAGPAHARPRPAGQRAADDRLCLPAAPPGARLRAHVGVHGDPEHPQRVRADGVGAGGQQRRRPRDLGGVCGRPG